MKGPSQLSPSSCSTAAAVILLMMCFAAVDSVNVTYPARPHFQPATGRKTLYTDSNVNLFSKAGNLDPVVRFTRSTRNTVGLKGVDMTYVNTMYQTVKTDGFEVANAKSYFQSYLATPGGYAIPVIAGMGIVCGLLIPIIGLFFCCCRCCGCCGGKRVHKNPKENWFRFFVCMHLFCALMLVVGGAVLIAGNTGIEETVTNIETTSDYLVDDAFKIVDNAVNEVNNILFVNYPLVLNYVFAWVYNASDILGGTLQPIFDVRSQPLFSAAHTLIDDIDYLSGNLTQLNTTVAGFNTAVSNINGSLNALRIEMEDLIAECSPGPYCDELQVIHDETSWTIDPGSVPNIQDYINTVNDVQSIDLPGLVSKAEDILDDIPKYLRNYTTDIVKSVNTVINSTNTTIFGYYNDYINKGYDVLNNSFDLRAQHAKYVGYLSDPEYDPYFNYKSYALWALGGIGIFIGTLALLGWLCGVCSHVPGQDPAERSDCSECAGKTMMAVCGFIFILSLFLWFLTVLFWLFGAAIGQVCLPLQSGAILAQVVDNPANFNGELPLTSLVYGDNSVDQFKLYDALENCRANEAIITAIGIERRFNLTELTDIDSYINVTDVIHNALVNFNLSDFSNVIDNSTKNDIRDKAATASNITIDFSSLIAQLHNSSNYQSIPNLIAAINGTANSPPMFLQSSLNNFLANLSNFQNTRVLPFNTTLDPAVSELNTILFIAANISQHVNLLISRLDNLTNWVSTSGNAVLEQTVNQVVDHVLDDANAYIAEVLSYVRNQLFQCGFLANLYALATDLVCNPVSFTVDEVWFGLGCVSFFSLLLIIFSVKLAKWFHRMEFQEVSDQSADAVYKQVTYDNGPIKYDGMEPMTYDKMHEPVFQDHSTSQDYLLAQSASMSGDLLPVTYGNMASTPASYGNAAVPDYGAGEDNLYSNGPDGVYQTDFVGMNNAASTFPDTPYSQLNHNRFGAPSSPGNTMLNNPLVNTDTLPPYPEDDEYKMALDAAAHYHPAGENNFY